MSPRSQHIELMWSGLINDENVLHKCEVFLWKGSSPGLSLFHPHPLERVSEPFSQQHSDTYHIRTRSRNPGLDRPHNTMSEAISNLLAQLEPEIQDPEEGMCMYAAHV